MLREFLDSEARPAHAAFQEWRTENQTGLFLALDGRKRALLHGARCHHLGSGPPYFQLEDGFGSLTRKRKVCGTDLELQAWALTHAIAVKSCQHCVRDGLLTPRHTDPDEEPSTSFTQAEFFPVVARLIMDRARLHPAEFVSHDTIVTLVLEDAVATRLVRMAIAKASWPSERVAASNMVAWFSQQITVGRSSWTQFFERIRNGRTWAYRPVASATATETSDDDVAAIEGEPRMFFHLRRERDPKLVRAKRAAARHDDGSLRCEACGFIVERDLPGWTHGDVCEVHHRSPLAAADSGVITRLEDLAILCPTCHRAIHRTRPLMSIDEFRERFRGAV